MDWRQFWQILSGLLYAMNVVLVIYTSFSLLFKRRDPIKTISWILVMLLLPYIGITLYFFLGRNFRKEKMYSRKGAGDLRLRKGLSKDFLNKYKKAKNLPEEVIPFHKLIIQNLKNSNSLLLASNGLEIYFSGKESLSAMYKAMQQAKEHIHLQSFIVEDDIIGNRFKELMIQKAKEGVEVRFLVDGFGGRKLSKNFIKELKEAGIEILIFSPFKFFFLPPFVNYRNHRKILVVDGKTGFLGGVNIADRYYDGGKFEEWRDTHVKLTGDAVISLQASFLLDRFFIINKNLKRKKYYPQFDLGKRCYFESSDKKIYTQVISSGPDSDWSAIMQCYATAITQAKDHIYIISPYFIPNETILDIVKITALSDVEVSIMIPERSDTWLAHWGTMSYISELLAAGVNIYLFERGFNHSKVLSIDGEFCIIGSANMDNRSFEHHFEVTSVIYDSESASVIETKFNEDLLRCKKITSVMWHLRPKKYRIYESIARIVAPML
ncbi:MAG: cardiolipin synthase [Bacteroidales bacterium]|nr:cardiolipin synthase [Bacteroidales bacterium]